MKIRDKNDKYLRSRQVQPLFIWPPPEKQQVKQWVYQTQHQNQQWAYQAGLDQVGVPMD